MTSTPDIMLTLTFGPLLFVKILSILQPMLLLWGAADPWIRPQSADRIQKLYPNAEKVLLPGVGHCPQVSKYHTPACLHAPSC